MWVHATFARVSDGAPTASASCLASLFLRSSLRTAEGTPRLSASVSALRFLELEPCVATCGWVSGFAVGSACGVDVAFRGGSAARVSVASFGRIGGGADAGVSVVVFGCMASSVMPSSSKTLPADLAPTAGDGGVL